MGKSFIAGFMMNNQIQPNKPDASRASLRLDIRESLIALGLTAAFFGVCLLQFLELPGVLLLLMTILFAATIWLRQSWGLYGVLTIVFFLKFSRVGGFRQLRELTYVDFMFPMVLMALAGACFRYLEVGKFTQAFDLRKQKAVRAEETAMNQRTEIRRAGNPFPSLLGGRWWLIPTAVTIGFTLLTLFPHDSSTTREYWITPRGARAIFLGSFLFFLWFICRSVYSLIMRWKMDPQQASVQVRSIFAQEFWREQVGIEGRRARIKSRQWKQARSKQV